MLNIRDALELYTKLEKFTPNYEEHDDSLDFAGTIIHDIRNSDTPEVFAESILLMYPDLSVEALHEKSGTEVITLFMEGLAENKFLALIEFCRSLGYGRRSNENPSS
jgi:hypothetical protein